MRMVHLPKSGGAQLRKGGKCKMKKGKKKKKAIYRDWEIILIPATLSIEGEYKLVITNTFQIKIKNQPCTNLCTSATNRLPVNLIVKCLLAST